ncbi:uncharacterized protein LOC103156655 [Poecilia formosa]|uniref:uncharacterized protein LOC103156655 n=1 Tax=Poecilia formosa TaxID=48698 RepID=UPI0004444BDC|nr:PREDICTED: uncharacterized protein LOC103156655 [Poecilia formosa]
MIGFLMRLWRGVRWIFIQTGIRLFFSLLVKIRVVTSGQTFGADEELLNQLGRNLELLRTDRNRSSVTLLFCPITSRVGSDVEAAMSNLSGDQNVILVLMHHTRDPSYSTVGTDWADVYPNVISSVHVLFHESVPGLLTCSQNNMAVDQMLRVLRRYRIPSWKINIKLWGRIIIISLTIYLICKNSEFITNFLPSRERGSVPELTEPLYVRGTTEKPHV